MTKALATSCAAFKHAVCATGQDERIAGAGMSRGTAYNIHIPNADIVGLGPCHHVPA